MDPQIRICRKQAAELNLIVVGSYKDEGSANLDLSQRPGLRALLTDAENHKFQSVLMVDLDQLSRDIAAITTLLGRFRSLDISIVTASDGEMNGPTADRILWIFGAYLDGMTAAQIAQHLNKRGVR